jgi:lipid A ethanolaminephosphotransferase
MDKLFARRIDASLLVLAVALLLASLGNVTFWTVLVRAPVAYRWPACPRWQARS